MRLTKAFGAPHGIAPQSGHGDRERIVPIGQSRLREIGFGVSNRFHDFPGVRATALGALLGVILSAGVIRGGDEERVGPFADSSKQEIADVASYFNYFESLEKDVNIATITNIPKMKIPASITIITKEQIEMTPAHDLTDLIAIYVPDALFTRHEGGRIGIRGIIIDRNYKILLLVNGKCMNERIMDGAATELANWDLNDIERVEVIRGPGSVTYGPGAIAGVINIITKQGISGDGAGVTIGSAPNFTYNSHGGFAEYSRSFEKVKVYGYGSVRSTAGLSDPSYFVNGRTRSYAGRPGVDFKADSAAMKDRPEVAYASTLVPQYADPEGPQIKAHADVRISNEWRAWARYTKTGTVGLIPNQPCYVMGKHPDGEHFARAFARQETNGRIEYNKAFSDLYSLTATLGAGNHDMMVYMNDDSTVDHDAGYSSNPPWIKSGNLIYAANEKNAEIAVTGKVTFRNGYQVALGLSGSYDKLGNSPVYGTDLADGPALQLPSTYVKNSAGTDSASLWNLIGDGFSTYFAGAFAEANLPFHDRFTLLGSFRVDKHEWTGEMLSPRIAVVSEVVRNHVLKAIVQQSVRMNLLPEVWMSHIYKEWQNSKEDDYEKIVTGELIYTGVLSKWLSGSATGFVYENEALGWVAPASSVMNGYQGPIGTSRVGGAELELRFTFDRISGGINQSYTKLLHFKSANPKSVNGISIADYNVPLGDGMVLQGTGKSLNNWANRQTKLHAIVKLPYRLTVGADLQAYWAYEGYLDALQMWKKAYDMSTLPAGSVDTLRRVIAKLEEAGCGKTNVRLGLSCRYRIPVRGADVSIRAYAMNLLGTYKQYFNATRIDSRRPYRLGWWNEPASFGLGVNVGL